MNKTKPATEYGRLIQIKNSSPRIVNISRVRLFECKHNWHSQLIHDQNILIPTDQTEFLGSNYAYDIDVWDEVWMDGVCIFKKSMLKRVIKRLVRFFRFW